jgi:anthranilate phosphoribosyltransferase
VIGVSDARYLGVLAGALAELGARRALVVSGSDGVDEISVSAATSVVELNEGEIESFELEPEALGLERAPLEDLTAGTPDHNAAVVRHVLAGGQGAERSLTLANAGAAIYVAGRADSIAEGVRQAAESIDSGAAAEVMERYVARTRELAPAA